MHHSLKLGLQYKAAIAVIVVVLLSETLAFAGLNMWTTGGPFGGNIQQVVVDPSNPTTLYLVAANRAYKSTNSGLSWSLNGSGLTGSVARIAVDPINANNLYAGASNGVFKSTNGGSSWSATSLGLNTRWISLDPQTPSTIYAVANGAIYKSIDSGGQWNSLAGVSGVSLIAIAPSSPLILFVIANGDPFRSTDGGYSWTAVGGLPATKTQALAIDPTNANTIYAGTVYSCNAGCDGGSAYKSTNGGATWVSIGLQANYTFFDIAVSASDPNTIYASAYYGASRTTDGGASWTALGLPTSVSSLAIDPANANVVYAGTAGTGVFRSSNGGANWLLRSNGLLPISTGQLALANSNPNTLFVTGGGAIFKSTDNGAHWAPINAGTTPVYSLAIDPSNQNIIYAGGNYGPSFAGVHKSTDGGLFWQLTSHDPSPNVFSLAIAPGNPNVVYSGAGGGGLGVNGLIARTIDAGANWSTVTQLHANANNLAVDPANPGIVYAVLSDGSLYKTADSGVIWNVLNDGLPSGVRAVAVDPNNSQIVYAGTNSGVFKTLDAGSSWTQTTLNRVTSSLALVGNNSSRIYAGTVGFGVYESTDAGATWSTLNLGLGNLSVNSVVVDPSGSFLHASTGEGVFDYERVPIEPATHFGVTAPAITTAGNNISVVVTALDASNQKVINYNETVHFSSSDAAASLPSDYTFVVKPNQQAASGSSILIHQDFNALAVSGIGQKVTIPTPLTINSVTVQFANSFPKNGFAYLDIVRDDGTGNPSTSASDILATSTNANQGAYGGNFTFILPVISIPAGTFHIVVRTQNINANGYSILSLTTSSKSTMAGLEPVTVQNPVSGVWSPAASPQYMYFSINDDVFGDAGQHTFNVVLKTAGTQSITVTDTTTPTITGTQAGIIVQPANTAGSIQVTGFPSPIDAGTAANFIVTVRDPYGNTNTGYTGTIHFTSSDSQAVLPPDYSFLKKIEQLNTGSSFLIHQDFQQLAVSGISQKLVAPAAMTINSVTVQFANSFPKQGYLYLDLVKDDGTGKPSNSASDILGTSSNVNGGGSGGNFTFNFPSITVPAGILHLVVRTQNISANGYSVLSLSTTTSPTLSGLESVMVQNPSTGTWSVAAPTQHLYFSLSAGEGGTHSFTATLNTPGTQSITATDVAQPSVNGSQPGVSVAYSVPPPGTTPAGTDVSVQPVDTNTGSSPASLTFSQVNTSGVTTLVTSSNGPPPPNGFKLGSPPTYFNISTSATFSGFATVCINYAGASYQNEANLKLLHFESSTNAWQDITMSLNTQTKTICGQTTSLSPFAVVERDMPPVITVSDPITAYATSGGGAAVHYTTPTATDDFDGTVAVNCSPQSGATFGLGTTNVNCTATDTAGNTVTKSFNVFVIYSWSGLFQPINGDGSSIFKLGSTIPVKFQLTGASAGIQNATARLYIAKISNGVTGTELEAASTVAASTGNQFHYDPASAQYIFNWGTKGLVSGAGTYQLRIDLGDGVVRTANLSLRK